MSTATQQQRTQLFVVKTDKRVFEALDGLNFGNPKFSKIQLGMVDHEKNPSVYVSHNVDPDVMKVLAHEILNGGFDAMFPSGYTEYKGTANSKREDGKPESRVLKISKRKSSKPGEVIRYPWTVQINVGPGKVVGEGAVTPDGVAEKSVNMLLSDMDMKRFAVTVLDHIRHAEIATMINVSVAEKHKEVVELIKSIKK